VSNLKLPEKYFEKTKINYMISTGTVDSFSEEVMP
jgi:hypothetical protein